MHLVSQRATTTPASRAPREQRKNWGGAVVSLWRWPPPSRGGPLIGLRVCRTGVAAGCQLGCAVRAYRFSRDADRGGRDAGRRQPVVPSVRSSSARPSPGSASTATAWHRPPASSSRSATRWASSPPSRSASRALSSPCGPSTPAVSPARTSPTASRGGRAVRGPQAQGPGQAGGGTARSRSRGPRRRSS